VRVGKGREKEEAERGRIGGKEKVGPQAKILALASTVTGVFRLVSKIPNDVVTA